MQHSEIEAIVHRAIVALDSTALHRGYDAQRPFVANRSNHTTVAFPFVVRQAHHERLTD